MFPTVELREMGYNIMPIIGWIIALVLVVIRYKEYNIGYCAQLLQKALPNKKIETPLKLFGAGISLLLFFGSVMVFNGWFGALLKTGANYFGCLFFFPIVLLVLCCIFWINPIKRFDFIAPAMPFSLIFIRLGCLCMGCCNGIEWKYGIYNYFSERPEVPTPLLESILALCLFIFLLVWRKKAKPGTLFPIYMFSYSFGRFFIEFFSAVRVKYFNFFNKYQFLCLIGMVIGSVLLFLMAEYGERISKYFDENPYGFIKALIVKIKKPKNQKVKTK